MIAARGDVVLVAMGGALRLGVVNWTSAFGFGAWVQLSRRGAWRGAWLVEAGQILVNLGRLDTAPLCTPGHHASPHRGCVLR